MRQKKDGELTYVKEGCAAGGKTGWVRGDLAVIDWLSLLKVLLERVGPVRRIEDVPSHLKALRGRRMILEIFAILLGLVGLAFAPSFFFYRRRRFTRSAR